MFPNESGLSDEEVVKRRQQYGYNILPEKKPQSQFSLLIQQLANPLVYVLLLTTLVTLIIGDIGDAIIIFLAVFINTVLGFIQESRSYKALFALKHYVTAKATVVRSGKRISINTSEIVPGDMVILDQGAKIPADGKLTFANRLYIDEALLTGESLPVNKNKNETVFMGTVVSSGQAVMLVQTTVVLDCFTLFLQTSTINALFLEKAPLSVIVIVFPFSSPQQQLTAELSFVPPATVTVVGVLAVPVVTVSLPPVFLFAVFPPVSDAVLV